MAVLMMFPMAACSGSKIGAKTQEGKARYKFSLALDSPEDTVTYLFADKFKQLLQKNQVEECNCRFIPMDKWGETLKL